MIRIFLSDLPPVAALYNAADLMGDFRSRAIRGGPRFPKTL